MERVTSRLDPLAGLCCSNYREEHKGKEVGSFLILRKDLPIS